MCLGAILCQGARQISKILTVLGMADCKRFEAYHRFLNRDKWDPLLGVKILLGLLIPLIPSYLPLVIVVDDTVERRKGKKIKAKGWYRDAVRSTQNHVVTCFGLKWLSLCLIIKFPWSSRPWALPFLTLLQYSKAYHESKGKSHRTSIDYTILSTWLLGKWLKQRQWILLGDGAFTCLGLIHACKNAGGHLISRLCMDARLYSAPVPSTPGKRGRKCIKGKCIESFKSMVTNKDLIWKELEVNWYGEKRKLYSA